MVSVCMATRNGGLFIREQLDSILLQLGDKDEVVISDDFSSDETLQVVRSLHDPRIRIIENLNERGIAKNFEDSLSVCKGEYIFLADQDDVWLPGKIEKMLGALRYYDLVVSDCQVVDYSLKLKKRSFYDLNNSGKGLLKNLIKNSYMGCCMAFTRELKDRALPFPADIPIHDFWIGLIGELYFKVHFMQEALVLHRRHGSNASTSGGASKQPIHEKLAHRFKLVRNLFIHKYYAG
jgi:glycosyltransferase involved in cell wall biosynthesis